MTGAPGSRESPCAMPVAGDIHAGLHQNWEQIVAAALREEADGIGLSVLSGAHMTQFSMVLKLLAARGARDIVVFRGGIVPEEDIRDLPDRRRQRPTPEAKLVA